MFQNYIILRVIEEKKSINYGIIRIIKEKRQ